MPKFRFTERGVHEGFHESIFIGEASLRLVSSTLAEGAPQATYREFTSSDGRNIKGRIIKYDAGRKKICFGREDHKQVWISSAAFSKEDLFYIRAESRRYCVMCVFRKVRFKKWFGREINNK